MTRPFVGGGVKGFGTGRAGGGDPGGDPTPWYEEDMSGFTTGVRTSTSPAIDPAGVIVWKEGTVEVVEAGSDQPWGGRKYLEMTVGPVAGYSGFDLFQAVTDLQDLELREWWLEWYQDYRAGFDIASDAKHMLFPYGSPNEPSAGRSEVQITANDQWRIRMEGVVIAAAQIGGVDVDIADDYAGTGWKRYRVHFDLSTDSSTADGTVEVWHDNDKVIDEQNFITGDDYALGGGWDHSEVYLRAWNVGRLSDFVNASTFAFAAPKIYDEDPGW